MESSINHQSVETRKRIETVDAVFNLSEDTKEEVKEKVISFIEIHGFKRSVSFIAQLISFCYTTTRSKINYLYFDLIQELIKHYNEKDSIIRALPCKEQITNIIKQINEGKTVDFKTLPNFEKGSLKFLIKEDLLDEFKELAAAPGFSFNSEIECDYSDPLFSLTIFSNCFVFSILQCAAFYGSEKCFKYAMMNGCKLNENICMYAIAGGSNEIVHILEQGGFKFNNCLNISVMFHRNEMFSWLSTHFNYKPVELFNCINYFDEQIFFFYIENGDADMSGEMPFFGAVNTGNLEILKYLRTCGVDENVEDIAYRACQRGHFNIIEYLVESGLADKIEEKAPLVCIATNEGHTSIVEYLVSKGYDKEVKSQIDMTLLHVAAQYGFLDIVEFLVNNGSELESRDLNGNTPLFNAVRSKHLDIIKYLISKGASADAKNDEGKSPFDAANETCDDEIIEYMKSLPKL